MGWVENGVVFSRCGYFYGLVLNFDSSEIICIDMPRE